MPIEAKRLSGSVGAEVAGVDLANLDDAAFTGIHAAFLEHHVLVFRDQKLTPDQQIDFGRMWGELFVHPIVPHLPDHPELIPITNLGKRRTITEVWHSDVTFAERPPMASGLYAVELPTWGGDTVFSNQHLAYERLSDGMKRMLGGLRAIHTGAGLGAVNGKGEDWRDHGQCHPVIRTHPESGRPALFVNPAFTVAFEDMSVAESRPLLQHLYGVGQSPDLCYRHRWLPGDLVLWDNRSVQHYAVHDHGDAPRTLHRFTVAGDEPR